MEESDLKEENMNEIEIFTNPAFGGVQTLTISAND
nr:MAG TPA: hypothetical protein [Caudoviricetes sp.]